ncbi:hypothetical protein [Caudoviricetes sp.]|nr:hypothetical protein [Caudoviricetes sp.]
MGSEAPVCHGRRLDPPVRRWRRGGCCCTPTLIKKNFINLQEITCVTPSTCYIIALRVN